MKFSSRKSIKNNLLLQFDDYIIKNCDKEKLSGYSDDILLGINNFTLFQKFSYFRWPAWLNNVFHLNNPSFHHITPFLLLNNNYRDVVLLPNSVHYTGTDLTGMISPVNENWSIEFWIIGKGKVSRPQENTASVAQTRDLKTYLMNTRWEEKNFKLTEEIYNIEHLEKHSKEIVVHLDLLLRKSNIPHRLFIVIRPYNFESLGNVKSIEYNKKSGLVKINNHERVYLENTPDRFYSGNGTTGDIPFSGIHDNPDNVKCKFGMATMAFGYNVIKGDNEFNIRINPGNEKIYKPVKTDYQKRKSEYIDNSRSRFQRGINLVFPDNKFQSWFDGSRISALNHLELELSSIVNRNSSDLKTVFYLSSGYNRMGLFHESKKIINAAENSIDTKNKPDFTVIINSCYYILSFSDYFKLSRDIDHLQVKYKSIREVAVLLFQYSTGLKKKKNWPAKNSIDYLLIEEYHLFDIVIIASALFEFSYLARCLGIFNDEIKFSKESQKLEEVFLNELENAKNILSEAVSEENEEEIIAANINIPKNRNEHSAYNIFAGYPFYLKALSFDKLKEITGKISGHFTENPVYFKTIGAIDTLYSIVFANNLLMLNNNRAHTIIEKLFEYGRQRYVLPDYADPKTGHGIMGCGDSGAAISAFFRLLRSVIFVDSQDRLEIFPMPKKDWFAEGSEIKIENAPSIFGNLNFRCSSTRNEVQLYFYDIPKFIPPEIMINLPFPARIKQEDDFIIKKETANSSLIHGWPEIVRFKKK